MPYILIYLGYNIHFTRYFITVGVYVYIYYVTFRIFDNVIFLRIYYKYKIYIS